MISIQTLRRHGLTVLAGVAVFAGAVVLAIEPSIWLYETWANSAFDSAGGHFFVVLVGLFVWSVSSPVDAGDHSPIRWWPYLAATLVLRLAGEVLVVPVLGALALVVDVYLLGRLARLGRRRRAVSPFWLAAFFSLTLPVEYVAKRLFGYGLQHLAADGACGLLRAVYSDVTCSGVDIALRGQQLFVDLPCSGARALLLFSFLFTGLAALLRPSVRQAAVGAGLVALAAFVVNVLRIALLTAGLAHEPSIGVDVMRHPWHMMVGLGTLPVGFIPVGIWAYRARDSRSGESDAVSEHRPVSRRSVVPAVLAVAFLGAALAVPFIPRHPVDVADGPRTIDLPDRLVDRGKQPRALRPVERDHFERYGGGAARADYGPHRLLVVETEAPLRHLHEPDEWLGDVGYTVEKTGRRFGPLPTASYRVEAPNGRRRRVDVTFISDRGRLASSTAEAVWYWLSEMESNWRALYRFHPLDTPPHLVAAFDREVAGFFDVPARRTEPFRQSDHLNSSSTSFHSPRIERSYR